MSANNENSGDENMMMNNFRQEVVSSKKRTIPSFFLSSIKKTFPHQTVNQMLPIRLRDEKKVNDLKRAWNYSLALDADRGNEFIKGLRVIPRRENFDAKELAVEEVAWVVRSKFRSNLTMCKFH